MQDTQNRRADTGAASDLAAMSRSMIIVMVITIVAKITGFLRETVLASHYGVSGVTDAIKTATEAPTFILSVLVVALAAAIVPTYNEKLKSGKEAANRFTSNVLTIGMIVTVIVMLATALFLPQVIHWLLPYAADDVKASALSMARMMLPMGIFVFLSRMVSAYLQANFSFAIPALSQLFLNIVSIGAIMISGGANVMVVAAGTLVGWFVQFLVQVPRMRSLGYRYRPSLDLSEPLLRDVGMLMLPLLFTGAFDQAYLVIRAMASDMAGYITVLDLSTRLSTMVSAVLLTTIATVLYPSLVRHVEDTKRFRDNLSFGINLNLLLALPASSALLFLATPITRLVYERGAFSSADTAITATTLAMTSIGILGVGLRELLNRCFYAHKDIKAPTIVGIFTVAINGGLSFLIYPTYGAPGIAVATSISALFSAAALLVLLHTRHRALDGKRILVCLGKSSVATGVMIGALLTLMRVLAVDNMIGMQFIGAVLALISLGIVLYLLVLWLLRTEELRAAGAYVLGKIRPKKHA